jgi:hypothetical protein
VELSALCYKGWYAAIDLEVKIDALRSLGFSTTYDEQQLALLDQAIDVADCLSPAVVPVPDPTSDIPTLCMRALSTASALSAQIQAIESMHEMGFVGSPTAHAQSQLAQLDRFISSYCQ